MIGYANPFDPKVALHSGQRYLAIALRFAGWIAVPAAVGSTAGLLAAEQKRLLYSRDSEERPKLSRTDRFLLWAFKTVTWPIKWVVWPLFLWPFVVYPIVFVFTCSPRRKRARRRG